MKRWLSRGWAVPAAALVLVFALAAVSWAATTGTDESAADASTTEPALLQADPGEAVGPWAGRGMGPERMGGMMGPGFGGGPGHMGFRGGPALDDEARQQLEELREQARQVIEEQRDQWLDQLAAEMTPEDRSRFEELRAQAEEQRSALEDAREALRETTTELRELMREYLPLDSDAVEGSDDTGDDAAGTESTAL